MARPETETRPANLGRQVPHNLEAEEAVLGAAMLSSDALEYLATELDMLDFYKPGHQLIYDAMRSLWEGGIIKLDPVIVADELKARGLLETVGGPAALIGIMGMTPATSNAPRYGAILLENTTRRGLIQAGTMITDLGYEPSIEDAAVLVDQARSLVAEVSVPMNVGAPSPNVLDFVAGDRTYDWLVEGLLERMDRLVLTGGEGGGKSTALRQFGLQVAAGMHPFTFTRIKPCKVLMVDVENSENQIRRELRKMLAIFGPGVRLDPDNLRIESRVAQGLDLLSRHDSRWLMERIASNRPDILITGPIYKMHHENPNDETVARKVQHVFEVIRGKFGCALLLEAHSAKAANGSVRSLEPRGSSAWLGWPEFGYGMRADKGAGMIGKRPRAVWLEAWRGDRDARSWPAHLVAGDMSRGEWPWMASDRTYEEPQEEQF